MIFTNLDNRNCNKYGAELNQNQRNKQVFERERRSNMRASIAVAMHRHGIPTPEIDSIINESYEYYVMCKNTGVDVYEVMREEVGLNRI